MNKLFKKVFLSIISLLLVVVTMASTTFAWMTINSEAWVEGMYFQATGGEGFLISVDGDNFKTRLTEEELYKAVVSKYKGYEFVDSEIVDENGNVLGDNDIKNFIKEIELIPLTSINKKEGMLPLTDLLNQSTSAKDGTYIEFDIYFKRVDNSELAKDVLVYLNGEDYYSEDILVPHTKINSKKEYVNLKADLTCIERNILEDNGTKTSYKAGDKIALHSSNAMRLGIVQGQTEKVIELSNNYNLGSYATDSEELMYKADSNAMYTYYNNLKNNSLHKLNYQTDLTSEYYTNLVDQEGKNQILICSLKGNEAVKVTFKLWLEGWDADCFDGIGEQISVQLSFVQKENMTNQSN